MKKKISVSHWDVEELAAHLLGLEEEFENDEIEDLDDQFYDKFNVSLDDFHGLVEHLMPYTVLSKSEISETLRIGFVDHEKGVYLVKSEYKRD